MNFGFNDLIIYSSFFVLLFLSLNNKKLRKFYRTKSLGDWVLDLSNLSLQGTIIPLLQVGIIYQGLKSFLPQFENSLSIGFIGGFIINFFIVDYFYYWNHRILHIKKFFYIHLVHHSVTEFDVFATSKNTIWTSFFLVYLPMGALFLFLLDNPYGYLVGAALSGALDLWKHSRFVIENLKLNKITTDYLFIMTPAEHSFHHGRGLFYNYGANLNLWDKIHGTYQKKNAIEDKMGVQLKLNFWQKLLYPVRRN